MSPPYRGPLATDVSFPRVSGDEPTRHAPTNAKNPFSPRERG